MLLRGLIRQAITGVFTGLMIGVPFSPPAGAEMAASAPSMEAQNSLRQAFQAERQGFLSRADALFGDSISEWKRTGQPADETAAMLKARANVRKELGKLEEALSDLNEAVRLVSLPSAQPEPAEIRAQTVCIRTDPCQMGLSSPLPLLTHHCSSHGCTERTYVLRARVNEALNRWEGAERDLSEAILRLDELDAIEATNPYLFAERSEARARLRDFDGAAEDAQRAEADFKSIGDKVRRLLSASDAALALYASDPSRAVDQMRFVFKSKGNPASNNPDDIGLLQELSRKDAELHLAYAAHLFGDKADRVGAERQWESGCIRVRTTRACSPIRAPARPSAHLLAHPHAACSAPPPASTACDAHERPCAVAAGSLRARRRRAAEGGGVLAG